MYSGKFCGVHTPYNGLRVYSVGCMGLPGVEVTLEESTSKEVEDNNDVANSEADDESEDPEDDEQ